MSVQVVSFRCVLKNKLGHLISSTFNQNVLTARNGGHETLGALVDALQDLRKGEKRKICLRADEAYGYYDPDLVLERNLDDIVASEPLKVGDSVFYEVKGEMRSFRVTELNSRTVTLDANHPLAGQDLIFEIEATAARAATSEEIDASRPVEEQAVLMH